MVEEPPIVDRDALFAGLQRLVASDAPEARLTVEHGDVYLQYFWGERHDGLRCEAVTSNLLPPELKLSSQRAARLRELGFEKVPSVRNWVRLCKSDEGTLKQLSDEADEILGQVYGVDGLEGEAEIEFEEDEGPHPQNGDLIEAMLDVASSHEETTRQRMYRELINATFLVPLDPATCERFEQDGVEMEGGTIYIYDTVGGHPLYAAFTDWESLRRWEPRGWSYIPIHGSEFFEEVLEREAAGVLINPEGPVGGQLYRHEIEMLVEAMRSYRNRQVN